MDKSAARSGKQDQSSMFFDKNRNQDEFDNYFEDEEESETEMEPTDEQEYPMNAIPTFENNNYDEVEEVLF
jgi:hypothetical protein